MADLLTLKRRSAAFHASGQVEKARAVDAEIARMRGVSAAAADPEPDVVPVSVVETAEADLDGVEVAAAVRRGPGRPRKTH